MQRKVDILHQLIDVRKPIYIRRLRELVSIPSISNDLKHTHDVLRALRWCGIRLKDMGFDIRYRSLDPENVYEGDELPMHSEEKFHLPYMVCASHGTDKTKRTVLVYGHIDVKGIGKREVWCADPFDLQIVNDFMYGRGVADDKGPVLGWINAIESFFKCEMELPVNIRFIIDGSEETGSEGYREGLREMQKDFLKGVEYVVISDNYWLNMDTPCLTYGLRGVIYFYIYVDGSSKFLHSGCHGGAIQEPLIDLEALMSSLVDESGKIKVPGIYDSVRKSNEDELRRFEKLDFNPQTYTSQIKTDAFYVEDKVEILRRRWLLPAIDFHGIEKSFHDIGAPTLLPNKVMGKFSFRIVPDQNPRYMAERVKCYLEGVFQKRCSSNELTIKIFRDGQPFLADPTCNNYRAAFNAIKQVWKKEPDLTRDGATIAMAVALEESTKKDVVLIPMGECQDFQHEGMERMSIRNYLNGMKVFISYLCNICMLDVEDSEAEEERQGERDRWRKSFW